MVLRGPRACGLHLRLWLLLEPIVRHRTCAALAGLITVKIFPTLSKSRWLADRFASCENIVSRSQSPRILLVITKDRDLWPAPTPEVRDLRTHCQI